MPKNPLIFLALLPVLVALSPLNPIYHQYPQPPPSNMASDSMESLKTIYAEIPVEQVIAVRPSVPWNSYNAFLDKAIRDGKRIVANSPNPSATDVQIQEFEKGQRDSLFQIIRPEPGKSVQITSTIVDVLSRSSLNISADSTNDGGKQVWVNQIPLVAIGQIQTDIGLDDAAKKQIARINSDLADRLKEINSELAKAQGAQSRKQLQEEKGFAQQEATVKTKTIRAEASERSRDFFVYFLGDQTAFVGWEKGQSKTVRGIVQAIQLKHLHWVPEQARRTEIGRHSFPAIDENPDVSIDVIVRFIEQATAPTSAPSLSPTTLPTN